MCLNDVSIMQGVSRDEKINELTLFRYRNQTCTSRDLRGHATGILHARRRCRRMLNRRQSVR